MPEFTSDQEIQIQDQLDRYSKRAQKHEQMYTEGKVQEEPCTFFNGLAGKYYKAGILRVQDGPVSEAQQYFATAADRYLQSARQNNIEILGHVRF